MQIVDVDKLYIIAKPKSGFDKTLGKIVLTKDVKQCRHTPPHCSIKSREFYGIEECPKRCAIVWFLDDDSIPATFVLCPLRLEDYVEA